MFRRRFSRLISLFLVYFCVLGNEVSAQQDPAVDPWQFPELTNSKPFQRGWWAFEQRAYPLGDIPDGAKLRALGQIRAFKARQSLQPQAVQGNIWVNIGPAPIQGGQTSPPFTGERARGCGGCRF